MTVRARLTLWYSGLLVSIVLAFAVASYAYIRRLEYDRVDRMLHEQSEIVEQSIEALAAAGGRPTASPAPVIETLHDLRARGIRAWIFGEDGVLRVSTADVREGEGPDEERSVLGDDIPARVLSAAASRHTALVADVPVGRAAARLLATPLSAAAGHGMLLVSYSLGDVDALMARARRDAALAILAALMLSLGAGYLLARRSMAPVSSMSGRAALIGASNLHERIPVHDERDELGTLALTFNDLLDRVAAALEQQRRFMADASHELRTPVAIMRGEAEIALSAPSRTAEAYRESLTVFHKATERLSHSVEDIFLLALVDARQAPVTPARIYLDDLVAGVCRTMRSLAEARGMTIDCKTSVEAPYVGDEQLLERLLANLLDNAIKHSSVGVSIDVRLDRSADEYRLTVANAGPVIPREARPHIFDRFFRVDAARAISIGSSGRVTGSGLGLPIAKWIAQCHGGSLELLDDEARTTFLVRLPLTPVLQPAR